MKPIQIQYDHVDPLAMNQKAAPDNGGNVGLTLLDYHIPKPIMLQCKVEYHCQKAKKVDNWLDTEVGFEFART